MTVKELFDFVTDPTIKEGNIEECLDRLMEIASQRPALTNEQKKEDDIFKNSYIPFNMNEVVDFERDFRRAKQGQSLIYTTLHGIMPDLSKPRDAPEILDSEGQVATQPSSSGKKNEKESKQESDEDEDEDESDDDEEEDSEEDDDDEDDEEEEEIDEVTGEKKTKINMEIHVRPRDESPNSKKVLETTFLTVVDFKGLTFFSKTTHFHDRT